MRKYREDRLAGTGLTPIFPLWGLPTPALARDMIAGGLRARLSTIDPRVMPRELIGAEFDEALLVGAACRQSIHAVRAASSTPASPPVRCSPHALDLERGEIVEREGFVYGDLIIERNPPPSRGADRST